MNIIPNKNKNYKMKDENLDRFFDDILGKNEDSGKDNSTASELTDKKFEYNLRKALEKTLPITKLESKTHEFTKEFKLYQMDLFNQETKKLIKSKKFLSKEKYFYLEEKNQYFFIDRDDLSTLYYYISESKNKDKYKGFEETQQLSIESTKFFLNNDDIKSIEERDAFFDDIKLNLISKKTVSFIGNNNNIPDDYLDNYYIRAKLLSHGKYPFAICLGKDKENKPSTGIIHYPMEHFYVKLALRKGQFDGEYFSLKEIDLSKFNCEIIYKTFDIIPENVSLLFEFKNGNEGDDKVILQAVNYQENAKSLLEGNEFYHIIIIRSKKLGKALGNKKGEIEEKKLKNFAILCLNNKLLICGKEFKKVEEHENIDMNIDVKEINTKKGSKKSGSSKSGSQNESLVTKSFLQEQLLEFKNSLLELIEAKIAALEVKLIHK